MSKERAIVEYLKNKYQPSAILLHGSRAVSRARANSDWDIIMIFDRENKEKKHREQIAGESIEWKAFKLPIESEDIIETFDLYLQFAKVLWEKDKVGASLLQKAAEEYSKGPNLSEDSIQGEKEFFEHKILSMKDDEEMSYMFFRHLCVLFNLASRLWFEVLHNEYPKPYYLAFPIIKEKDSTYHNQLMILCSNIYSNDEKIASAEWISKRLFSKR
ncbi:MAG: hypothetical protein G01um1014107_137 [Parcubacteria group bacterium Gr01-1014_107]|nr:MAG: hypothetical protein G01um1014107_137 [Parcubacteria group bacterium Gr01-1014_107]